MNMIIEEAIIARCGWVTMMVISHQALPKLSAEFMVLVSIKQQIQYQVVSLTSEDMVFLSLVNNYGMQCLLKLTKHPIY